MKQAFWTLASSLLVGLTLLSYTGCAKHESTSQASSSTTAPTETPTEPDQPAAATTPVELNLASWDEAQELIAQHKGKVVVFDLWSTSCPPCLKEFPGLVKLQKDFPEDVVCISFNCDYIGLGKPEENLEMAQEFLQGAQADIKNLMSTDADEDVFKKAGIVSLPVVRVFDREGKQVKQFDNDENLYGDEGFTYEKQVMPLVSELTKSEK